MTVQERFAANLRRLRQDRGLSREDLSWRSQVHRTQVSLLEGGHRLPRLMTLIKLAGAMGVTPNDLTEGITWEPIVAVSGGLVISGEEAS
jgi:transcriptional regulator with XRE-family HTH domain